MCPEDAVEDRTESLSEVVSSSFEDEDFEHVQYLRGMVRQYSEYMRWYELGFVPTQYFLPESVEDVYADHMYSMSWFYGGFYTFDSWEEGYDDYLRQEVDNAQEAAAGSSAL